MISKRHARRIRAEIEKHAETLTDETALEVPEMFAKWEPKAYETGERVRYGGELYKCVQAHPKNETYTPDAAVSLWALVLIDPSGEILPWVQPDSTNPYPKDAKVTHNGHTWVSLYDNNSWEPGLFGWEMVA